MNNSLSVANIAISTHNNLFSLNDLHKASGNEKKHQPALFLANKQTKDLISEIESENTIAYHTINGGKNRGTYVCRELVYAYAMWISPKFSLMVIRAFDAMNTGAIPALQRHTISIEQRHTIQKAIKAKCQHNSTHYQTVYHALYDHFKVESYKELLASDFDEAMAFITDFNLADDVSEYNSLWKLIGLLEYERIDKEIRELKRTIDTAYQQIERISRTKGLIYDAISEQKTNCPYNTNRLNEAKAFIEKQMVLKKQLGLIA